LSAELASLAAKLRGKFVVIDGPDGSGKSTQLKLLAERLAAAGVDVLAARDPGGTEVGDRIRSVLLDHDLNGMDVRCETLLFMASRAQLVAEVIGPALRDGRTVLCDRFVTSTCAYQGAAGFDPKRVVELARDSIEDCWPHVTFVLDVDVEEGLSRVGRKPQHAGRNRRRTAPQPNLFEGGQPDAMEARPLDFHRRVREIFLDVQRHYPRPVLTIDGRGTVEEVHERLAAELRRVFG
jgi:dTMP kinase